MREITVLKRVAQDLEDAGHNGDAKRVRQVIDSLEGRLDDEQ